MDYDIFLSLRVIEFRNRGFSDEEAIKLGFSYTASTITVAGLIMLIAFGSLLISTQQILDEFGFFIGVSVLIDTFLVRTLIVPCVMLSLGPRNWWPRKMCAVNPNADADYDGETAPAERTPLLA